TKLKLNEVNLVLKQFEEAKQQNRNDKKLNEVALRKLFLSLTNLIKDTLEPLCNGSICFPDIEKITNSENDEKLQSFVFDNGLKEELSKQIESLKIYFEQNGGYVPYGRATLNKYTALQKPNKVDDKIEVLVKKLKLLDFIKKYKNSKQLNDFIKTIKNKSEKIKDSELSLIEKVELFKYKTIPIEVQNNLSEYLSKTSRINEEQIKKLFGEIGKSQSPAKDYKDLENKEKFDLCKYPLKVAFDYAWESLAKSKCHHDIEFPKEKSQEFLEKVFDIDVNNNENFKLYSALLLIQENLATLDHSKPNDRNVHIANIENIFENISLKEKDFKAAKTIINWHKKLPNINQSDYDKAKQTIGQLREGLKNKISKFKDLTNAFQELSQKFDKAFAYFRDKLNERYEINKISHYGIIVEDANNDHYFLLHKLSENREEVEFLFPNEAEEFKTYTVKSLTSKALWKFLHNKKGISENFHTNQNWHCPKKREHLSDERNLKYITNCLQESEMSKEQNWAEFGWNFDNYKTYEEIEKEVDSKGYKLQISHLSQETISFLINSKNCLLLPIINQDISREDKKAKNQFTKDWEKIFADDNGYRLHPEFKISYRHPTPNYPKPEEKRYSRFQMIAHLICEYIPQNSNYISRKEQIKTFNNKDIQKESVENFNKQLDIKDDYYIFGIDRGIKQLATLCILNKDKQIQGDFEIYTREFDKDKKQWKHSLIEKRNILDLSNLRVETTVDNKKVLVDLSEVRVKIKGEDGKYVKDNNGEYKKDKNNRQNIKLKELAYIRKLQYAMQTESENVLRLANQCKTEQDITKENMENLITAYKEGRMADDIPKSKIFDMLRQFKQFSDNKDEKSKRELIELDPTGNLKTGIVANMIGVVTHLLEKYGYQVYISIEDLTKCFYVQKDGLSRADLTRDMSFKVQENAVLAGLGTYHYFEMQLLRKLFRIQQNNGDILHLVPAFRSVDNYEKIVRRDKQTNGDEYVNYPFGIVQFIDPKYTSKRCPNPKCEKTNTTRIKNILTCKECGFKTPWDQVNEQNINYIQNGDDNGAYNIALKALKNFEKQK
ncbi:MAG: transposase, partial [Campylobacteraceae bacterium]|nr:transposase [Campylobacteraceae bacterium]